MKRIGYILNFLTLLCMAQEVEPTVFFHKGKKVEVYPNMGHSCAKGDQQVNYQVYDDQEKACMATYTEYKCLKYEKPGLYDDKPEDPIYKNVYRCPDRKVIQDWKTIITSVKSTYECAEKVGQLKLKLKNKGFICSESPMG